MATITNDIQAAAKHLRDGGLVAFPTETVYGLGADAFNRKAVASIFATKQRPTFNPLIVHIAKREDAAQLFEEIDEGMRRLMQHFWPGPLTIVARKKESVPDLVTAGLETVAVRMPANATALELIAQAGTPVAAPSANKFGMLSPTTPQHVLKQLPQLQYILDGELPKVGIESTVIEVNKGKFKLLRPGVILADEIRQFIPEAAAEEIPEKINSPGLLKSHYSPNKPIFMLGTEPKNLEGAKIGILAFKKLEHPELFHHTEVLSPAGDLTEAAANFFLALHRLEESDADLIIAEPIPEEGIGKAIMDRLKKAVYQYQNQERL